MAKEIYTIGHSTRSLADFIALLKAHGIQRIVDVRTIPKSRHCPQFNETRLKNALKRHQIYYTHLKELGGLRHTHKNSINTGWENPSFRGFADHMQTEEFKKGIRKLEKLASKKTCAIMCAEALFWRCHRNLIADALTIGKWDVFHIQSKKTARPHQLTTFLKKKKGLIFYP